MSTLFIHAADSYLPRRKSSIPRRPPFPAVAPPALVLSASLPYPSPYLTRPFYLFSSSLHPPRDDWYRHWDVQYATNSIHVDLVWCWLAQFCFITKVLSYYTTAFSCHCIRLHIGKRCQRNSNHIYFSVSTILLFFHIDMHIRYLFKIIPVFTF